MSPRLYYTTKKDIQSIYTDIYSVISLISLKYCPGVPQVSPVALRPLMLNDLITVSKTRAGQRLRPPPVVEEEIPLPLFY